MRLLVSGSLNGLAYGFILFLVASGLTVTLGLMRTFNLAHGAMYMVGGYIAWDLLLRWPVPFWIVILVSGVVVMGLGLLIELVALRPLLHSLTGMLLATFGFLTIITNGVEWFWNSQPKAPRVPDFLAGALTVGPVRYPTIRLAVIVFGALLAVILWYVQEGTRLGAFVKAGMDDPEIAAALGINVSLVGRAAFAIGAFVAGASGAFGQALLGLTTDQGLSMLLLALIVIILGGLGSLQGALAGGIAIGLVTAFGTVLFPQYVSLAPYAVMILVLVLRPQGLLGRVAERTG